MRITRPGHRKKKFLFVLPTLCDMTATTLMNVGLSTFHLPASVYQMLRGAVGTLPRLLAD